jgi:selenide,water dikinase
MRTPAEHQLVAEGVDAVQHLMLFCACTAGAVSRNLESYGQCVDFDAAMPTWQQHLLADPQTSGGLLVAVAPGAAADVLQVLRDAGCGSAAVIGWLEEGESRLRVTAAAPDS